MKAFSNIKPDSIQDLGDGTFYININIELIENQYQYDSILIKEAPNYEKVVSLLIREKYSLDDELSLNSKSMSIFLNTCTQEEKIRWTEQLREFTTYRVECIRRAKEMCNMI